jgi:hypothetical protein
VALRHYQNNIWTCQCHVNLDKKRPHSNNSNSIIEQDEMIEWKLLAVILNDSSASDRGRIGVFYAVKLKCQKCIGDDVRDFKYVFTKKKKKFVKIIP